MSGTRGTYRINQKFFVDTITLRLIFMKHVVTMWTGFIRLRTEYVPMGRTVHSELVLGTITPVITIINHYT
jgi:hypothetical protein